MPAKPGFRSRQEIEARHWQGRRRARRPMPHGKSLMLTGVVVLVLVSTGLLTMLSLVDTLRSPVNNVLGGAEPTPSQSSDPFAGTPAAAFPEQEAGIVLPRAAPIGDWTAEQVQDVLNRTKRTLVAARIDDGVVELGNPAGYLATISESARATVAATLEKDEALGYLTRLDNRHRLLAPVRVKGKMTVAVGSQKELVVTADFVWVYALTGTGRGIVAPKGAGAKLVILHAVETYQWFSPQNIAPKDTGLRPGAGQFSTINMDCQLVNTGRLGLPRQAGGVGVVPNEKAFDPSTPPEALPNTC